MEKTSQSHFRALWLTKTSSSAVLGSHARRRSTINTHNSQDLEPRMECDIRDASGWRTAVGVHLLGP